MVQNILIGGLLILLTSALHALLTRITYSYGAGVVLRTPFQRVIAVEVIVLLIIFTSFLEGALWAGCYMWLDCFQTFEEALYFSLITLSTVGYGDVVLNESNRLLAGFEAANGVIMFGWSTAILVSALQRLAVTTPKLK